MRKLVLLRVVVVGLLAPAAASADITQSIGLADHITNTVDISLR